MEEPGRLQSIGSLQVGRETSLWFSLSHNGESNGNPLQCSCLENPRDGRAWWAAIYGVAQSRTRLKRLSNSSSSRDRGAWWAAVYGVSQSRTWLKRLSSSSSSILAWRIPWTEESGELQSMGSQRIRHHWTTNTRCSTGSCFCRDTVPPQFSLFYRRWQESRNSIKEYPGKYRFHIISEFTNHKFLLINFDNLSSSNTDSLQLNNNAQSTIIIVSCAKKNMYICL